jgi:hypothetical protein
MGASPHLVATALAALAIIPAPQRLANRVTRGLRKSRRTRTAIMTQAKSMAPVSSAQPSSESCRRSMIFGKRAI